MALGAHSQDIFGQFRGLFQEFGAKRGGRAPPPLWIRACRASKTNKTDPLSRSPVSQIISLDPIKLIICRYNLMILVGLCFYNSYKPITLYRVK